MNQIISIKMDALNTAIDHVAHELADGINIHPMFNKWRDRDKAQQWGVNWAACGTQTPEEAVKFAQAMTKAADICGYVNHLELSRNTIEDPQEYTADDYHQAIKVIKDLLNRGFESRLEAYLTSPEI